MAGCRKIIIFLLCLALGNACVFAGKIVVKSVRIPMEAADPQGLEALLVWKKNSKQSHPVVIISHGSPRNPQERAIMSARKYLPIAKVFAKRGWAVAIVMRRGYGTSGGGWAENFNTCADPDYDKAAKAASADLHAAIDYLKTKPQFNTNQVIAIGVSAGGFATIALTADNPPPGLVAGISFAGGRGSLNNDQVCNEAALISTFGKLGETSRVPMLWVYAKNDRSFNPTLAKKFLDAFNSHGGQANLMIANNYGDDGHGLFSVNSIDRWSPIVESYIKERQLTPSDGLSALDKDGTSAYEKYKKGNLHKAFAISPKGSFGWRTGRNTADEAKKDALEYCNREKLAGCKIYSVDDKIVF